LRQVPSCTRSWLTSDFTNSASGLGRACVEDLIKHGANVAILDMNEDGKDLAAELGSSARRNAPWEASFPPPESRHQLPYVFAPQ